MAHFWESPAFVDAERSNNFTGSDPRVTNAMDIRLPGKDPISGINEYTISDLRNKDQLGTRVGRCQRPIHLFDHITLESTRPDHKEMEQRPKRWPWDRDVAEAQHEGNTEASRDVPQRPKG